MRYFLIKATKKRGQKAEFHSITEMGDIEALVKEYGKAELAFVNEVPVLPYSLIIRDEDDVLNALGRRLLDITNELNNDLKEK